MLELYRGDSLYNLRSRPGLYRTDGITSAAMGAGGDPRNIENISPLQTVKRHIDHTLKLEKDYYQITDYISFTDREETARKWAAGNSDEPLIDCRDPYLETRYLFKMHIAQPDLEPMAEGVWLYRFACNPRKKTSNVPGSPMGQLLAQKPCPMCLGIQRNHSLILIDTLGFSPLAKGDFKRANRLADNNKEWLVLPNDPLSSSSHRCTRIQPADFWTVERFTLASDEPRDPLFASYGYPNKIS
jgi:hypothetical protein